MSKGKPTGNLREFGSNLLSNSVCELASNFWYSQKTEHEILEMKKRRNEKIEKKKKAQLQPTKRTPPNTSRSKNSNTQRTENKTADVVIHQHSRRLLKMDILMSETCRAHNK